MEAISVPKGFKVTPEQFDQLADTEQFVRMELTKDGELIIMSPTGGTAGRKNSRLTQRIRNWADQDGKGEVFDSSTVFVLPNGARRSPDVSWIKLVRWNQLTQAQQDGFPPIVPDFVIELLTLLALKGTRIPFSQGSSKTYPFKGLDGAPHRHSSTLCDHLGSCHISIRCIATLRTRMNSLRKLFLSSYSVKGEYPSSEIGTPQGGCISPLLANLILYGLEDVGHQLRYRLLYWAKRKNKNYDGIKSKKLQKQKFKCNSCKLTFTPEDILELHHIDGNHNNWKTRNLEVLHKKCHQHKAIHSLMRVKRQQ